MHARRRSLYPGPGGPTIEQPAEEEGGEGIGESDIPAFMLQGITGSQREELIAAINTSVQ